MQIEIYSNLEAYVCHDIKSNFSNEKKTYFTSKFSENPVSKRIALFRLRCLPERKRCKVHVSLNIGNLRWFCLLFSANKHIAVGISSRAAFYLFVVARVGTVFPQFCEVSNSFARVNQLQSEQICHYIHFCKIISALLFLRKHVLGLFSHVFYFLSSFSGFWNECKVVPMLML